MGNLTEKCLKSKKKEAAQEVDPAFESALIESNQDEYFVQTDFKLIAEKYPDFNSWIMHGMTTSREKYRHKRIKWKEGEVIGNGSYGKVLLGLNLETGGIMAVKQVGITQANNNMAQTERIKALEIEIDILSKFSHKNIVRYYGSSRTKNNFNIFLEYISGGTIASLLDKYGPFNENLIRVYTRQILEGLEYLHIRNTVHRDIKGANVLVDNTGVCKLTDFGTAKRISSLVEKDGKFLPSIRGTINWMAPEVIKQNSFGRFCDIWSLGCTVIEMATGKMPWSNLNKTDSNQFATLYQIAQAKSPPPLPKNLSPEALDFLKQCFKINPKERPNVLKLLRSKFISGIGNPTFVSPEGSFDASTPSKKKLNDKSPPKISPEPGSRNSNKKLSSKREFFANYTEEDHNRKQTESIVIDVDERGQVKNVTNESSSPLIENIVPYNSNANMSKSAFSKMRSQHFIEESKENNGSNGIRIEEEEKRNKGVINLYPAESPRLKELHSKHLDFDADKNEKNVERLDTDDNKIQLPDDLFRSPLTSAKTREEKNSNTSKNVDSYISNIAGQPKMVSMSPGNSADDQFVQNFIQLRLDTERGRSEIPSVFGKSENGSVFGKTENQSLFIKPDNQTVFKISKLPNNVFESNILTLSKIKGFSDHEDIDLKIGANS